MCIRDSDTIGVMSCNPSIGGVGKGHLVREIDALGGEMGKAADYSSIQYRRLNTKKGPAVQATRVQADRNLYRIYMKKTIENQENLLVKQRLIHSLIEKNSQIVGAETSYGEKFTCKCLVITPGTFPNGLIHVGDKKTSAGRSGEAPTKEITNIQIGEQTRGGIVQAKMEFMPQSIYDYKGVLVSGSHWVVEDNQFIEVEDSKHGVLTDRVEPVYTFKTSNNRIWIHGIEYALIMLIILFLVAFSRVILKAHTVAQVTIGSILGLTLTFIQIHLLFL